MTNKETVLNTYPYAKLMYDTAGWTVMARNYDGSWALELAQMPWCCSPDEAWRCAAEHIKARRKATG